MSGGGIINVRGIRGTGNEPYSMKVKIINADEFGGSGGEGTTDHSQLTNRDAPDQHPQSSITGLVENLAGKASTSLATQTVAGLMPAEDKAKLDGINSALEAVENKIAVTETSIVSYIIDPTNAAGTDFTSLAAAIHSIQYRLVLDAPPASGAAKITLTLRNYAISEMLTITGFPYLLSIEGATAANVDGIYIYNSTVNFSDVHIGDLYAHNSRVQLSLSTAGNLYNYNSFITSGEIDDPVDLGHIANEEQISPRKATANYAGLMTSEMLGKLNNLHNNFAGKGGVTSTLTLYIRTTGNDDNDGLSEEQALASLDGIMNKLTATYRGYIGHLSLNFGAGTFSGNFSLGNNVDVGIGALVVQGVGIDDTTIWSSEEWFPQNSILGRPYHLDIRNLRIRKAWATATSALTIRNNSSLVLTNIWIDSPPANNTSNGINLTVGGANLYCSGELRFSGAYSGSLFNVTQSECTFAAANNWVVQAGATYNRVVTVINARMLLQQSLAVNYPSYNGTVPTSGFANVTSHGQIIFANAAAQTAWLNGQSYTASTSSYFGVS